MVITMRLLTSLICTLLPVALAACVSAPGKPDGRDRVPVNTPALSADLQAVRSAGDFRTVQNRYARSVSLTVAKALESYVPSDYAVFPEPGIDLARPLLLDRSRTWHEALPAALHGAGIDTKLDPVHKTIRLTPLKTMIPTADS
jgi:hypothetical protein